MGYPPLALCDLLPSAFVRCFRFVPGTNASQPKVNCLSNDGNFLRLRRFHIWIDKEGRNRDLVLKTFAPLFNQRDYGQD